MGTRRFGAQMNIANGIREFAVASPREIAVVDGDRSLTYAALDERASRLANAMLGMGLRPGDRVAFLAGNRLEYPEVAAGLAKARMPMVPINPRLAAPEVEYIVGHSEAKALILDDALAAAAGPAVEAHGMKNVLSMSGTQLGPDYEAALESAVSTDARVEVDEWEPFCVAYTAGTTGRPKGVQISHRSRTLLFYCTALDWGLGPGRRTIAVAPMYHGAGFAFAYAAVHTGGTLAVLRHFEPEEFLAMVQDFRPNSVFLVPTHAQFIRNLGEEAIARYDTSSLTTLYFNAAPLPQPLKVWVCETFPHVGVYELYGSTEAGVVTCIRPPDILRKERCVGPPWFFTEVRLVDAVGDPVAPGGTGELYSRSPFLMNGYLKDPEATEAATSEDGFFSSGDIAMIDDERFIYVVDRKKDVIISAGVNVYPREVEEVLVTHPSISEAAVIGLPSEIWGEEVTAVVVLRPGAELDLSGLEAHCRARLAGFKLPKRYEVMNELPRNAAGKILKRELRDTYAAERRTMS